MARYILLRVEDNGAAESLAEALDKEQIWWQEKDPTNQDEYRVVEPNTPIALLGLFGAPTLFCECEDRSDVSARSKKFGWWVHRKCGKPKKGNMQHPYNLLDPDRPKTIQDRRDLYVGVTEPRPKED